MVDFADLSQLEKGGVGAGAAAGGITAIAGMLPSQGGKGANIAAQSLFTASAAANAIPVAGQFASAGLAIAGLLVKVFGGKRKAKKRRKAAEIRGRQDKASAAAASSMQSSGAGGMGLAQGAQSQISTAPVAPAVQPAFSSYGGGTAPSVQPTQQAINGSIGIT